MTDYAMLLAPSANRVYTQSSAALAVAEMRAFGVSASVTELGGHSYLEFSAPLERVANLSSAYAFFERHDEMLKPVQVSTLDKFDDDLISIQKYAGKTNEHFTKLLLNVTALASEWDFLSRRFVVLDPVAGRGTTLNQALMYGWDAIGIEIDNKDVSAYEAFVKTYLRRKRIKHTADMTPVRRDGKRIGRRFDAGMGEQRLTLFEADTRRARALMKVRTVDLIVGDLPYGVVHNAKDLLESALPQWVELLRPGGAIGVSWNTHHAPREAAVKLLVAAGLAVVDDGGFEHWVDQGITRDIVVARKPRG
jgi:SAM-dependent methyltransferase